MVYQRIKKNINTSMENCIDQLLQNLIEILEHEKGSDYDANTITKAHDFILGLECHCDDYNGFDCGCASRNALAKEAMKELEEIYS